MAAFLTIPIDNLMPDASSSCYKNTSPMESMSSGCHLALTIPLKSQVLSLNVIQLEVKVPTDRFRGHSLDSNSSRLWFLA